MFKRFYKETAPATDTTTHILRDRHTGAELARGSLDKMRALQSAFGVSFIDPA